METFSALLAICAGNSPVNGEFPAQRPVTRCFDVFLSFFLLNPIKRLSKQSCSTPKYNHDSKIDRCLFLAATKQLYEWFSPSVCPSVRPSVRPSHLFDYVPINVSSWNFQELLPKTKVTSMQKMEVRGQRSRSQRSRPNLTVSGL